MNGIVCRVCKLQNVMDMWIFVTTKEQTRTPEFRNLDNTYLRQFGMLPLAIHHLRRSCREMKWLQTYPIAYGQSWTLQLQPLHIPQMRREPTKKKHHIITTFETYLKHLRFSIWFIDDSRCEIKSIEVLHAVDFISTRDLLG